MNKPTRASDIQAPKVTVGPIRASTKIYTSPAGHDDVRVPFREIALTDASEPSFRVYDPSGPYTDPNMTIDVAKGLPRFRDAWVAGRGGVEAYDGRSVKPEDNGNVSGDHAARVFPTVHRPMRATSPLPSTGRGRGWGEGPRQCFVTGLTERRTAELRCESRSLRCFTPTPNPSPQGGGGSVGAPEWMKPA
jgi:phosphomethylpyrimidine synthase